MRGSCGLRPPEYRVGVRRAPRDRGHLPEGGISGLSTCHVLPPPECPQMSFGVKSMCVPESGGARVQKKPRQPRRAGQGEGEVPGQSRWAAVERPQAVPGGPQPKGHPPGRSIPGHHGGDQWSVTRGHWERGWPVEDQASGALRGTPRGPCQSAWEPLGWAQPMASPLSSLSPKGTAGGEAGAEAGSQDQCKAQSHPPHHPRGWFKAASQSEAGRWGKKKA